MRQNICTCDRCGRDIKQGTPDRATLICYKNEAENRTDKQIDLCPTCYGHFLTEFCKCIAARMGINIKTPKHQPHSVELLKEYDIISAYPEELLNEKTPELATDETSDELSKIS